MDDATQKLVDEARRWAGGSTTSPVGANLVQDLADALEAAQRPPVPGGYRNAIEVFDVEEANGDIAEGVYADQLDVWLATQRPPVSPEVRDELAQTKVPIIDASGRTHWVDLGYECADALLARFSVPSQPVYDEEKIAQWLGENHDPCITEGGCDFGYPDYRRDAAALVAALRGGELTREETNE